MVRKRKRYIVIKRAYGSTITIDLDKLLSDEVYETQDNLGWNVTARIVYK